MKQSKPYFSIIVPTLNEGHYLPKLLGDLDHQTFKDFEVIIVDGHSDDNTVNEAKAFSNLNPKIITTKQRNVSHQRNLGAARAKADWIIFFDADNQLSPSFLEDLVNNLDSTKTDAFTCFIKPDSTHLGDKTVAQTINLSVAATIFFGQPEVIGAIIGIKKNVFNTTTGFNPDIKHREDSDLFRRVSKHHKVTVFKYPQIIFSFRRFKKEGTLKLIRKYAKIRLKSLINPNNVKFSDYPMLGGAYYDSLTKQPLVFDFTKLEQNLKRLTAKQKAKFKQFLETFLEDQTP